MIRTLLPIRLLLKKRDDYDEVVPQGRLRSEVARHDPTVHTDTIDDVVLRLTRPAAAMLEIHVRLLNIPVVAGSTSFSGRGIMTLQCHGHLLAILRSISTTSRPCRSSATMAVDVRCHHPSELFDRRVSL